ncbi:DUF3558 domain-containing protein [Streptomyces poonensis]|uniref:DUF3558 domain-containing protein n=1 Tax=Streptomyces poonensis TaxID=68255 RepID=A0A918PMV7_9ACTN|nr:DUF3558 domain-containing protein [Streptomyces poonensis]GGZ15238.1 hypothetical protein GCM10010365_38670 [Streptomyces poonensis]GLJ91470.1 hypothetical protein GCM10017589_40770 [Streptomyces poonensis]
MQPKAYVPGVAVLLAALLAGCTGTDDPGGATDNRPGDTGTAAAAAEPGRYRTLPEACGAVSHDSLDALLPGIQQIPDVEQRETAYEGEATLTYDTDRRVGCRWKVESRSATDRLLVDFERVVSYDNTVSDDTEAETIYTDRVEAADLPEPSATGSGSEEADESAEGTEGTESADAQDGTDNTDDEKSSSDAEPEQSGKSGDDGSSDDTTTPSSSSSQSASGSAEATATPSDLQPRILDDLADDAFLNDELGTARQRTVTVVFRTSNVIVTIEYAEQPTTTTDVPDSEEMQDSARKLAERLADSLDD